VVTSAAELRGGDYLGAVLNQAQVMAGADGGQIVLSRVTAGLVVGAGLVDVGGHRFRGLSGVEHLFQVRADGLPSDFPTLRTIDAVAGLMCIPAKVTIRSG
jgi:class 3 adenylate cyclase